MKKDLINRPVLQSFRNGEECGFDFFFKGWYKVLVFFARQYVKDIPVAEDIVEEAFIRVWAKRDQMETEAGLKGYLYKSVYHACLRWLEREKSAARNLAAYKSLNETEEQDCSVGIINAETIRLLHEAIETLPEQCRKIFKRLYVEGKTVKETAAELKLTISTINNQKARGISLLRERLGDGLMLLFFFLQG